MLKANVGLSRKLSHDFNSTGFSVNLEGEITAPTNEPEMVREQICELYDLAEESLQQQIDRHTSDAAIGNRDERTPAKHSSANGNGNGSHRTTSNRQNGHNGNGRTNGDAATEKQVNYLLDIARKQELTTSQLEAKVENVLGQKIGLYDLTKREAGTVIDELTGNGKPVSNGR